MSEDQPVKSKPKVLFDESKLSKVESSGVLKAPRRFVSTIVRAHTTENIITDVREILADQVTRMRIKSSGGQGLDTDEVKNLRAFAQTLVELNREEREMAKGDELNELLKTMTPEQLLEYYQDQTKVKK